MFQDGYVRKNRNSTTSFFASSSAALYKYLSGNDNIPGASDTKIVSVQSIEIDLNAQRVTKSQTQFASRPQNASSSSVGHKRRSGEVARYNRCSRVALPSPPFDALPVWKGVKRPLWRVLRSIIGKIHAKIAPAELSCETNSSQGERANLPRHLQMSDNAVSRQPDMASKRNVADEPKDGEIWIFIRAGNHVRRVMFAPSSGWVGLVECFASEFALRFTKDLVSTDFFLRHPTYGIMFEGFRLNEVCAGSLIELRTSETERLAQKDSEQARMYHKMHALKVLKTLSPFSSSF